MIYVHTYTHVVLISYIHFVYLFIYLWLCWVFVALRGLSLVVASGSYSSLRCTGFSLQWLLLLRSTSSRPAGFSSCGVRAQQLWLTGSRAQAQQLWRTGLAAPWHVGSSWTRTRTCVPCTGRWILFFFNKFIYLFLFLAALGRRCCMRASSRCGERGLLFVAACGLLIAVASLVAEHRFQACGLQQLWLMGSRVQAQQLWHMGLVACGIFPDQGLNPCPLHWQADS